MATIRESIDNMVADILDRLVNINKAMPAPGDALNDDLLAWPDNLAHHYQDGPGRKAARAGASAVIDACHMQPLITQRDIRHICIRAVEDVLGEYLDLDTGKMSDVEDVTAGNYRHVADFLLKAAKEIGQFNDPIPFIRIALEGFRRGSPRHIAVARLLDHSLWDGTTSGVYLCQALASVYLLQAHMMDLNIADAPIHDMRDHDNWFRVSPTAPQAKAALQDVFVNVRDQVLGVWVP